MNIIIQFLSYCLFTELCVINFETIGNPGSRLLDQLVPASYLHLQDVVVKVAEERKQERKDPVLYGGQYKWVLVENILRMHAISSSMNYQLHLCCYYHKVICKAQILCMHTICFSLNYHLHLYIYYCKLICKPQGNVTE